MSTPPLLVSKPGDLDETACRQIAGGRRILLGPTLLIELRAIRDAVVERLERGDAVYGVTTGMGAASAIRLDNEAQAVHQENLMLARSVGSAPWLDVREARIAMAVRLRTLLNGDAGVSAELCERLADLLNDDVHPALPSTRLGAAGEIIPLAHLGAVVTGVGECLRRTADADDSHVAAGAALDAAGLAPFRLGPKEGVALIEGVPVTTGLALLRAQEARVLLTQVTSTFAAELALIGANRDPFRTEVVRSDPELEFVLAEVRRLAGPEAPAAALQAPVSFRVTGPALAQLARAADAVDAAAHRALVGVTDSPAFLGGAFVGTAGFDGFDLAAALDGLRTAVVHVAEVSAARLHRLLDDRVTGLPRQLSDRPGLHAGMVTVHKRAVGVVHDLAGASAPRSLGAIETSLGQEDVQSFSVSAAVATRAALDGARDVLACELLAVVQGWRLGSVAGLAGRRAGGVRGVGDVEAPFEAFLGTVSAAVSPGTGDRLFGRDVAAIVELLSTASLDSASA